MSSLPAAFRLPARKPPAGRAVEEEREPVPSIELLQDMALSAFRASGLVVVLKCALLGEEVVWAADGTPTSRLGMDDAGRVVYHGEELLLLLALSSHPEDLVAYHAMRRAVGRVEVEDLALEKETQEAGEPA